MNTNTTFPRTGAHVEAKLPATLYGATPPSLRGPLSEEERQNLDQIELAIQNNVDVLKKRFFDIRDLLAEIRDKRLYRAEFATFDEVLRQALAFERAAGPAVLRSIWDR